MLTILVWMDSDAGGADRLIRASELARRYWGQEHGLEGLPWPDAEALRAWITGVLHAGEDLHARGDLPAGVSTETDFSDPFFGNWPWAFRYYTRQRTKELLIEVFFEASSVTAETLAYGIRTLVRVGRP